MDLIVTRQGDVWQAAYGDKVWRAAVGRSGIAVKQIEGDGVAMSLRRAAKASAAGSGTSALKRLITVRAIPSKRCWLSSHVRRRRGRWPA